MYFKVFEGCMPIAVFRDVIVCVNTVYKVNCKLNF